MNNYIVFTGTKVSDSDFEKELLSNLPQEMFVKETSVFFNTPFPVDSIIDAEIIIDSMFQEQSIILLFDTKDQILYIRKGPKLSDVQNYYVSMLHFLCRTFLKQEIVISHLRDETVPVLNFEFQMN